MSRIIVTLTRQAASGASEIGPRVAEALQVRCIDRELLSAAAETLGRDERELADREERLSTRWERLIEAFSGFAVGPPEAACMPEPLPHLDDRELFELQSEIMRNLAQEQDCVVVGRAASWVLRGLPGHVPIFLHAPLEWRMTRLCATGRARGGREARDVLERSDRCRAEFLRRMAGCDWTHATEYALTLDTSVWGLDGAVDLIVACVRRRRAARAVST